VAEYVIAIDQGTTSSRALAVRKGGTIAAIAQREHQQHHPQPGWVEHDAAEIWQNVLSCLQEVAAELSLQPGDVAAIGITNQRETAVLWERNTGRPAARAIVWQDVRTQGIVDRLAKDGGTDRFRELTGLPLSTYFSATKLTWLFEHDQDLAARANRGELAFGTPDSWVLWNLTGGPNGGVHATDVSNASRTLLAGLRSLAWEAELLTAFGVPSEILPEIRSSAEVYGHVSELPGLESLHGVPVAGILGDQQAALFGHGGIEIGDAKHTYGTGGFLLVNTGAEIKQSAHGLIATVAGKIGNAPAQYAIEGSVAIAGALIQWLRDGLGLIASSSEVEPLARSVADSGGAVIVPAFTGLLAPHWRPDARGVIVGLTSFVTKAHLARAALEATALQTADVIRAAEADLGRPIDSLLVDGGMSANALLMQIQADLIQRPVVRPADLEVTALGASYAAGLAVGFWSSMAEIQALRPEPTTWQPDMADADRARLERQWTKALERAFDWEDVALTER